MGYIYCITSPSLKQYIGQTKDSIEQRFKGHQAKSSNCTRLKRAAKKYGWEHMVVEILVECPDEELDKNEIECIELYRTLVPEGYNCARGGHGSYVRTKEIREKSRASALKQFTPHFRRRSKKHTRRGSVCRCGKKWRARGPEPKKKHIGCFKTEEEARIALEKYEKEHPEEFD